MISKFLQYFLKLAFFRLSFNISSEQHLLPTKFSIFLKSACLLLVISLKFIFRQIEKHGFILPKTFNFLVQKHSNFYLLIKRRSLKIALPEVSICLKSPCLLLAIFLKLSFKQKEKRGFTWPKVFNVMFQKHSNFSSEKKTTPLKAAVPEFQKYKNR